MFSNSINIVEIIIADSLGLLILFICAFGSMYRVKSKTAEGRSVLILIISLSLCCIFETLVSFIDGNNGIVSQNGFTRFVNIFGNTITYIGNILMSACWGVFLIAHLNGFVKKRRLIILSCVFGVYVIALIVNCFVPFIFEVDSSGVYHRKDIGFIFNVLVAVALFVIDPIINFIRIKRKGGLLKFFPIWLFYIPAITGIIVQVLYYGICSIYVGLSLGLCGILMASQNDMIFRDKLTSLYNRYYLDRLRERMVGRHGNATFTAMMLDLNGFKQINDNFGHQTGDDALVTTANILRGIVGSLGTVIRYAGDEFVIILNMNSEEEVFTKVNQIRQEFNAFNEKHLAPYTLSVSIGYTKASLKNSTIDEIMNEIDQKMYADKMRQHELHPEWDR